MPNSDISDAPDPEIRHLQRMLDRAYEEILDLKIRNERLKVMINATHKLLARTLTDLTDLIDPTR